MSEGSDQAWYCVRTLTKREFITATMLTQQTGLEVLCPRVRYRKPTKRGTVWWKEAMFPSYFFAKFDLSVDKRQVQGFQGVTGLVSFANEVPSVPDAFVEELKSALVDAEEPQTLTLIPDIGPGDSVDVLTGPLAGQKGTVTRVLDGVERVGVLLEFLGSEQEVEMDLYSLLLKRPVGK